MNVLLYGHSDNPHKIATLTSSIYQKKKKKKKKKKKTWLFTMANMLTILLMSHSDIIHRNLLTFAPSKTQTYTIYTMSLYNHIPEFDQL